MNNSIKYIFCIDFITIKTKFIEKVRYFKYEKAISGHAQASMTVSSDQFVYLFLNYFH